MRKSNGRKRIVAMLHEHEQGRKVAVFAGNMAEPADLLSMRYHYPNFT